MYRNSNITLPVVPWISTCDPMCASGDPEFPRRPRGFRGSVDRSGLPLPVDEATAAIAPKSLGSTSRALEPNASNTIVFAAPIPMTWLHPCDPLLPSQHFSTISCSTKSELKHVNQCVTSIPKCCRLAGVNVCPIYSLHSLIHLVSISVKLFI